MEKRLREIPLRGDHITLGQLLKLVGMAGTGGDAKRFLEEMAVLVNGETESRRGRKLRKGDEVKWNGESIRIT